MAQSSSSQDLRGRQLASSSSTLRNSSRSKIRKDKGQQVQTLRIIASLQNITQLQSISRIQADSLQHLETPETRKAEPPVKEPFTVRKYNGKIVRDVLIDTHDLINEPGGFVINLTHHGQGELGDWKEISIHLGIKEKKISDTDELWTGMVRPGTITVTDDYAREVFRALRMVPDMESFTAILEINDRDDKYELKMCPEMSPEFLKQFIQTYPVTLTKLHVEMPGISSVYLPEWKFLLDQQTCLTCLTCNFGVVLWNFYQKCIAHNSKTLERIILRRLQTYHIMKAKYIPLNWKMFSNCASMKLLKVTCGYKNSPYSSLPHPPSSVFLHDNLDALPSEPVFEELHLGNIWVDKWELEDFCKARPNLRVCSNCNDVEFHDGDDNCAGPKGPGGLQLISVSRFDLQADYKESFTEEKKKRRKREKQLACIVLSLFHVILLSLAILFIIIYFGHLRNGGAGRGARAENGRNSSQN